MLTALAAAGCGGESSRQGVVRAAVQRQLVGVDGYELERIRCTDDPNPWFVAQEASVFICSVGRTNGDCDWYRVEMKEGEPRVTLDTRSAGCVFPF